MKFRSDLRLIQDCPDAPIKDVPQLYRADFEFAFSHAKGAVQDILQQIWYLCLNDGFKYTSIDIRTHMLMKGMYPCIPGWHCDDFYRPIQDSGPDLVNVEEKAPQQHYIVVLGTCSMTEFLKENIGLPDPDMLPKSNPCYFYYDEMLENLKKETVFIEPAKIYSFGPTAFHRGSPASENGWRSFIRITRSNHREPKNELRYQSNVYINGRVSW